MWLMALGDNIVLRCSCGRQKGVFLRWGVPWNSCCYHHPYLECSPWETQKIPWTYVVLNEHFSMKFSVEGKNKNKTPLASRLLSFRTFANVELSLICPPLPMFGILGGSILSLALPIWGFSPLFHWRSWKKKILH